MSLTLPAAEKAEKMGNLLCPEVEEAAEADPSTLVTPVSPAKGRVSFGLVQ